MPDRVNELVVEFVVRYRRGEHPDLREYLERAGEQREELAAAVESLLRAVPPPEPSEEALNLARAWVEQKDPPLLVLRRERRLKRKDVVRSLGVRLHLPLELREKLELRYHELETGQLEATRVDRRVWEALAMALRARPEELAAWAVPLPGWEAPVMFRAEPATAAQAAVLGDRSEPDEVDRLFGLS